MKVFLVLFGGHVLAFVVLYVLVSEGVIPRETMTLEPVVVHLTPDERAENLAIAKMESKRDTTRYCIVTDVRGNKWVAPGGGTFEGEWFTFKDMDRKLVTVKAASVEEK